MCVKKISNHSMQSSSEGMSSGGILTVDPDPDAVVGSLTSISSQAGASARLFFCCEIYGAYGNLALFLCNAENREVSVPSPLSWIFSSPKTSASSTVLYWSSDQT